MKMHSRYRYMYDAAPAAALVDRDSGTVTTTGASSVKTLDTLHGYWTSGELADKTLACIFNVLETNVSQEEATLTLDTVDAADKITITDGVETVTFTADDDYEVGLNDSATASNLADAINESDLNVTAEAASEVVTIVNNNPSGLAFSDVEASITASAVSGADETYELSIATNNNVELAVAKVTGPGQYVLLLDMDSVQLSDPSATGIKAVYTLTGEDPTLKFFSWISAVQK